MTASLLFKKQGATIGVLQLDATVSEVHDYVNEVSEFPSENGDTVVDNIRLLPDRVTIEGLVTNSPVTGLFDKIFDVVTGDSNVKEALRFSRDDTATRVESARDILLRIRGSVIEGANKDPQLVDIVTGLRKYTNMAMESLSFNRSGRTGQGLPFSATFVQVKTADVATETFTEPTPEPSAEVSDKASTKTQKGKQKANETSDTTTENVSAIKRAARFLTGVN